LIVFSEFFKHARRWFLPETWVFEIAVGAVYAVSFLLAVLAAKLDRFFTLG
jgi:hypothetical protein